LTQADEITRIEVALDVLVGEMVAIDMAPRALALKDGLLEDRTRAAILDAVVLLGERLRRLVGDDGPTTWPRAGIITDALRSLPLRGRRRGDRARHPAQWKEANMSDDDIFEDDSDQYKLSGLCKGRGFRQ